MENNEQVIYLVLQHGNCCCDSTVMGAYATGALAHMAAEKFTNAKSWLQYEIEAVTVNA